MPRLLRTVDNLLSAGKLSASTQRTYAVCWGKFERWAAENSLSALPATEATVLLYLASRAGSAKLSTLRVHAWSIHDRHIQEQLQSPVADRVLQLLVGVARVHGAQTEPKRPLTVHQLRAMLAVCDRSKPLGSRDAAVLLVGFASGLRRSDLAALARRDVEFVSLPESDIEGAVLSVGRNKREKNDQTGRGRLVPLWPGSHPDTCPVRALRGWLAFRGDSPGPLFVRIRCGVVFVRPITGNAVGDIVKRYARKIGLDPSTVAGHSLRSGLVTAAAARGVSDAAIMRQTGHQSAAMLNRYVRQLFITNPLSDVL